MTSVNQQTAIVWFRQDLRLHDNPALIAASQRGPVIPVYVWSPESEGPWPLGAPSKWWLHRSLRSLDDSLQAKNSKLILRTGDPLKELLEIAKASGAKWIFWNRRYEPAAAGLERLMRAEFESAGIGVEVFNGSLLLDPDRVQNSSGTPFKVFTAFYKAQLMHSGLSGPLNDPKSLPAPPRWPMSENLDALGLNPRISWDGGMREFWSPGEGSAMKRLADFGRSEVGEYDTQRDRPDIEGTSRLAPHLHFGEISPRQVWAKLREAEAAARASGKQKPVESYLRQIAWREFAHHLLHHFPETSHEPLRPEFTKFPWLEDSKSLRAWQRGDTGYPIVDAGMHELWTTGWMHNRVRMIVASFLIKDLLIHWREGAKWFWDTLVDADLANNTMGWQWVAGCGADAAPYFRIFNPVSQGIKFDPKGDYVRRWLPSLKKLPAPVIHEPWKASPAELEFCGVKLGKNYPVTIVDHKMARDRALDALARMKKK